jgi:dUTP pyrophosphatase
MGLNLSNQDFTIAKVRDVKTPTRGTVGSAGIDFYVPNDYPTRLCSIYPGERYFIPSGIKANVPAGYALIAFNKSGIALNKSLIAGAAVVDSDYQGEIHLHLINVGKDTVEIQPGQKILQFLLMPVDHCEINEVSEVDLFSNKTSRGSGGFGSTGDE